MSEFTQNKTAGVFATLLIGLIILAFMFTGYQQFEGGGSATSIGSVGGMPIKPEEYQQEYNRQVEFYKQIMGGDVSSKQLENFKVKENAIKNIVQRKLMSKLGKDVGVFPAEEEVKKEIKGLPYFQTNGQFDVTRYKAILSANHLTPLEFEEDVINQVRMRKLQDFMGTFPLSNNYLADLEKFRAEKMSAQIVQIHKSSLGQFISVSAEELKKFLAVETNAKRVESIFKERQVGLNKPEEVRARHILIAMEGRTEAEAKTKIESIAKEATASNFASLANKYTEDPSGKNKGGDLGSFPRGRMVPEFDTAAFTQKVGTVSAPVKTPYGYHLILVEKKEPAVIAKLEDYRDKFATEIIQKDKVEDIKNLTVNIANDLRKELEAGNIDKVKAIASKYKLSHYEASINRLDGLSTTEVQLSAENMKSLFATDVTKPKFHTFDDGPVLTMVRTTPEVPKETTKVAEAGKPDNGSTLKNVLARKMMENFLKQMEADTKVKINSQLLQM